MTRVVSWDGSEATDLRLTRVSPGVWADQAKNLTLNPSFEAGTTSPDNVATTSTMTPSFTTESPVQGARALRLTATTSGGLSVPVTSFLPITGNEYTLILHVRPRGESLTAFPRIRGTQGPSIVAPADVWTEVRATLASGSGGFVQTGLTVSSSNGHSVGSVIDIDAVAIIEGGYTGDYFSGDTSPAGEETRTSWEGTPNASASTLEEFAPAVTDLRIARTPMPAVTASSGFHLRDDGRSFFGKAPDAPLSPDSTAKMMTAYVARLYVSDQMLQDTVVVQAGDLLNGTTGGLQEGDVVTWDSLFHGTLMVSASDSSHSIARHVGNLIGGVGGHAAFREKANALFAEWNWRGAVFYSSSGMDSVGRITTRQLCELMFKLDEYVLNTSIAPTYEASATGPNPRTWTINHGLAARFPDFPEMIGVKTGMALDESSSGVVMLSEYSGVRQATAVLGVVPSDTRFPDTRVILDFVLAEGA